MELPETWTPVRATAPVRICDLGGWTDTWFAGHGRVCNIAAGPGVAVDVTFRPRSPETPPVEVHAESFGDRYGYDPAVGAPGRHPLLEAVIAEVGLPEGLAVVVAVRSAVPPGSAVGTSAAVTVALAGALLAARAGPVAPGEAARLAHLVETVRLGRQSGIQDHLASAHGGINDIEMESYPEASVASIDPGPAVWRLLGERTGTVFLGRSHDSSAVHAEVITSLERSGAAAVDTRLGPLRAAAADGAEALRRGDLDALGEAMLANTRAQAALHPGLVGEGARRVIDLAVRNGAVGVKVNGAGGDGGSVTILAGAAGIDEVLAAVESGDGRFRRLDLAPVRHGLRIERSPEA